MIAAPEVQAAARAMQTYKHCKTAKPGRIQRHMASLAARMAPARRTMLVQINGQIAQIRWNAISKRVQACAERPLHLEKLKELLAGLGALFMPCLCAATGTSRSGCCASGIFTNSSVDPPNNCFTDFNNGNSITIKNIANNLANKLITGAMIGLAGLSLGATAPKANAGVIYDSGLQSVTNNLASGGKIILEYQQMIEEVDTDENGTIDAYQSYLYCINRCRGPPAASELSFFALNINADLAGRGTTGMTNYWADWHYEQNGENMSRIIMNQPGGWPMEPGFSDTFYYTIPSNQVLGWENVGASMVANAGSVNFGFQAPLTRDMTTTNGVNLGWLADNHLVSNLNSSAAYEAASLDDADSDGLRNADEYRWGSNPNDPLSTDRISLVPSADLFSWQGSAGRTYSVICSDSLIHPSLTVTNTVAGVNGTCTFAVSPTNRAFFRVTSRIN